MCTIYVDGVYDLFHSGHLSFLQKVRSLNCTHLIVSVISDNDAESYKRRPIISCEKRAEILNALSVVDKVIVNAPLNSLTDSFLMEHGIDLVVYAGDPTLADPLGTWSEHYKVAIDKEIFHMIP